jgi:hypothetical protein
MLRPNFGDQHLRSVNLEPGIVHNSSMIRAR